LHMPWFFRYNAEEWTIRGVIVGLFPTITPPDPIFVGKIA